MAKRNAWASRDAEIAKLRRENAELRMRPMLRRVAADLGNKVMLVLANMPYEDWPDIAKSAAEYTCRDMPTAWHFYKDRLPKKER